MLSGGPRRVKVGRISFLYVPRAQRSNAFWGSRPLHARTCVDTKRRSKSSCSGYSGAPCTDDDENRWRVPPDTVIDLTVNLERRPKLSSLKLDRKRFSKTKDPELLGYTTYTDEAAVLSYAVSAQGRVFSINRFPAAKDDTAFKCSSAPAGAAPRLSARRIFPYAATQPGRKY